MRWRKSPCFESCGAEGKQGQAYGRRRQRGPQRGMRRRCDGVVMGMNRCCKAEGVGWVRCE